MELNGIFLINKEKGLSSRKIDDLLNKKFNIKKSGHLGTLDPFASGLLIIAVNKATKLLQFINDDIKEYIAVLKLGEKTETFDTEGEIIEIFTNIGYILMLASMMYLAQDYTDKITSWGVYLFLGMCAFLREAGIQHYLSKTDTTPFKSRFFLNPNNP